MSIFSALNTAISGMEAQSFALEQISGNIANSRTTAYKRTESNFQDLVPDGIPSRQIPKGVTVSARSTNNVQGDIETSEVSTHMAINGSGYFVVEDSAGTIDNRTIFDGNDMFTRRGDFELDRDGYLVNGSGYYLKGYPVDPETGNVSGSRPEVIRITNDFLPAQETSEISYRANLPAYPQTVDASADAPGSELLSLADYTDGGDPDPRVLAPPASASVAVTASSNPYVAADDVSDLLEQSVAGGSITGYDLGGNAVNVEFRWAKVENASPGDSAAVPPIPPTYDTWNIFYLENANATGAEPAWRNLGVAYQFGADGRLLAPVDTVTISGLSVNGTSLTSVRIDHGDGGITQFADANGTTRVTELAQNGYAAGEVVAVNVTGEGRIRVSYTNGQSVDVAEVAISTFNAENRLKKLDGGAFEATAESGFPIYGAYAGIQGSSLEASNTDISEEFSKLIVTQQAYSANSRVISTSADMLREALDMVR